MKVLRKFLTYFLGGLLGLILIGVLYFFISYSIESSANIESLGEGAERSIENGFSFRDLNKNGKLDVYEDKRQDTEARVQDLLSQMNVEEKAGAMFISIIAASSDGELLERPTPSNPFSFFSPINSTMIAKKKLNHFNIFAGPSAEAIVKWQNSVQKLAERTRLGIPITIASDPRHSFSQNVGANLNDTSFSSWCEPL
ncbi:MAG: glycoside hydrolase family 3 protein, partial [Bacteroidota bacterium]